MICFLVAYSRVFLRWFQLRFKSIWAGHRNPSELYMAHLIFTWCCGNETAHKGISAAGAAPRHHRNAPNSFETYWNPSVRCKHARTFPSGMIVCVILFAETPTHMENVGRRSDEARNEIRRSFVLWRRRTGEWSLISGVSEKQQLSRTRSTQQRQSSRLNEDTCSVSKSAKKFQWGSG